MTDSTYDERQKEIEAMEERFGGKWKELCLEPVNLACADALDKLWKDIILARDPDYGNWEYPGQAYRHLMAEYEDTKAENGRLRAALASVEEDNDWRRKQMDDAGRLLTQVTDSNVQLRAALRQILESDYEMGANIAHRALEEARP